VNEQLSAREIEQRFAADATRMDGIESRLTGVAKDAVMTTVWQLENGHVRDLIANVESRSKERHEEILAGLKDLRAGINQRSEWTWQRAIGIAGVVVALIALLITALLTSKGIH
jgi:hypothetical protein